MDFKVDKQNYIIGNLYFLKGFGKYYEHGLMYESTIVPSEPSIMGVSFEEYKNLGNKSFLYLGEKRIPETTFLFLKKEIDSDRLLCQFLCNKKLYYTLSETLFMPWDKIQHD